MKGHIFVRDRAFYNKFIAIAVPIVLQNLITIGINVMDNIMVGSFGEVQMSGASLSNQFYSIFQILCMGMGSGASVMTAQYWGRKDIVSLKKTVAVMQRICFGISLAFTIATIFFPHRILAIYTPEKEVIAAGVKYYGFLAYTFIFQAFSLTTSIVLRSIGKAKVPLIASLSSFWANIFFNWVFIFGKLGAPRMEIAGAAVGTLIARILECGIVMGYLFIKDKNISYRPRDMFANCRGYVKNFLSYGVPVIICDLFLGLGNNVVAIIMGHIGSVFVAGYSITSSMTQLATSFNKGISSSSGVITGNTIGEGDLDKAYEQGKTFTAVSIILGAAAGLVVIALAPVIVNLYNITPETKDVAMQLLRAMGSIMVFMTSSTVLTKGVLRGGGDIKFLLFADTLFLWCASIPLGYLAGIVLKAPPFLIYIAIMIDRIIKTILCIFRLASKKWIKKVY